MKTFSHYFDPVRLSRSGVKMQVKMRGEPFDVGAWAEWFFDSNARWRLEKMSRLPIDGVCVVKARGGGRWIRC